MPKINSLEVVHQDTNESSYQNLHDILVALNKSLALDKEVVDGDARASIKNLLEMYVNDKEAFVRSLLTIRAEFGDSLAQITEELMVRASQFEAETRKVTNLTSKVNDNYAELQNLFRTVVNQEQSLSQAILDLDASFNNNTAKTAQSITALASENEARASSIELIRVEAANATAEIEAEKLVRAAADEALALEISSMTAGVNVGFDPGTTWYYDNSTESWTASNATITWNAGWIDVEATGTAPSIISPTISVQGSKYNIIKARIQRKAGSTWNGNAYFTTSGHGFSSSYMKTIAEPYPFAVGDTAVIEFDMSYLTVGGTDWISSTITQIKLELGGTSTDDISVDWLAIGRNSPGASVASIEEEKLVRATADTALATSITSLSSTVAGNTAAIASEITARADADSALAADISTLSATVDDNTAAISTEATTRASADSALSSSISTVSAVADSKIKTYRQTTAPTSGMTVGDLWFDSDDNNKAYRYSGSSWVATDDARIATNAAAITTEATTRADADSALATSISNVSAVANGKNKTYLQSSAPSSSIVSGDIWIDSDDNKMYRYNGTSWVSVQDNQIGINTAAISSEATARANGDSANATSINAVTARLDTGDFATVKTTTEANATKLTTRIATYTQDTAPSSGLTYGDLWYDSNDSNKLYRWNGIAWVANSDVSGVENFISTTYSSDLASIESQIDSKVETWFQTTDPSTAWTTTEIRNQHNKDLWYSSDTKLLKIYNASSNTWSTIEDQAAIDAATSASTAQATADGKIVTFVQSSTPTAEAVGDLWIKTDENRKMYRWDGSLWSAVDDVRIATTYSRWGVQVDASGRVAGIQLNSDNTGTSEFTVLADNFRVYKSGNTSDPMFTVGSVNGVTTVGIKGNLMIDSSVGTAGIAGNAVTVANAFVTPGDVTWIQTSQVEVCGGWISTSGTQPITINFTTGVGGAADGSNFNSAACTGNFYVYIGGYSQTLIGFFTVMPGVMQTTAGTAMFTGIPAGTYYVKVTAVCPDANGGTIKGIQCRKPSMTILETKR